MGTPERQGYRDIFKRSVAEAKSFFRDAFDSATSGADIWLRDGQPRSITGKAAQRINQRQCEVWGKNPGAFRPAWSEQLREICLPYLEDKGLSPGDSDARSPFVGGQCNALYRGIGTVTYDRVFCQTGQIVPIVDELWATEFSLQGPIGGVVARVVQPGVCGALSWGLFAETATGEQLLVQVLGFSNVFNSQNITYTLAFELQGGGPDNCGNPPPEYAPGTPYTDPLPPAPRLNPDDPNSPTFDIDIKPDGSIEICSGDTCISIEPGPDGELPGDDEQGNDDVIPPGDQGEAGEPEENVEDEAEGECQASNLVGILVTLTQIPPRANAFFNSREAYYKGAYFVYFGGEGGFSQNPQAALTAQEQFYYAPEGCNKWRVTVNLGFRVNIVPFCKE